MFHIKNKVYKCICYQTIKLFFYIFQKIEDRTRINYLRKLNEMRKKNKQMEAEITDIKQKFENIEEAKKACISKKNDNELETRILKGYTTDLATDLEQSKTNRQLHFERLVIQQKKISMYNDIVRRRKPFTLFKTEDQLVKEYKKQKTLNGALIAVVDNLCAKFPNYIQEYQRLMNSLRLASLIFYS